MSYLTGTIKYPYWLAIDIMAFDIHVDSAFRATVSCHARPPVLDAAPQTATVRGMYNLGQVKSKLSRDHIVLSRLCGGRRAAHEADPIRGQNDWYLWQLHFQPHHVQS